MHPLPSDPSGIKVIVIGCGVAVLGCAIALSQKGHKVVVVFQKSSEECGGELGPDDVSTSTTPKVGGFVERWGLDEKLNPLHRIPTILHLGVGPQIPNHEHLHTLLQYHAQVLGIEIRTGHTVIAYRQNEVIRKAGVILDNGERVEGDLVLCVGVESGEEKKVSSAGDNPSFVDTRDHGGRHFNHKEDIAYPWPWTGSDPHWHFDSDTSGQSQAFRHSTNASDTPKANVRDHGDDISRRRLFNNKEDIPYPWTSSDVHFDTDASGQSQSGKLFAFTHSDEATDMVGRSVSSSSKARSTDDCDPLLPTWTDGRLLIIGSGGSLVSTNAHDTSQANTRDQDTGCLWTTGSDVHFDLDTSGQSQSGKAFTHSDEAANRLSTADIHMASVNVSSSSSSEVQSTSGDPLLPTWTDGRLLIIGGSLVSTNAHDAFQAIEDGVVLAVTLTLAGKHNVPLAVKAWESIRHHHRVRLIKKSTRGKRRTSCDATSTPGGWQWWHHTADTQELEDAYDAEKDAYELYSEVMLSLLEEAAVAERTGGKCAPVAWL